MSARARRRHARRMVIPQDAQGQSALLAGLLRRAHPTYELYLYALVSGAVLGLGYLLDSQAVLLLGILIAPLMTPWVGMLIGLIVGSVRFVFETFMALLISAALIFLIGGLTGFAARLFLPLTFDSAFFHSRLWIPELAALVLGGILLVVSFVRSESKPYLPSVILAYGLFLPISAAGFGLGSGVPGIWPQAALVGIVHLILVSVIGLLTLFALKLRPDVGGALFSGGALILMIVALFFLMMPGTGAALTQGGPFANVPAGVTGTTESDLPLEPTTLEPATFTPFVVQTFTPPPVFLDVTLPASETPTITLTFEPIPVLARIAAQPEAGLNLRETPSGKVIITLDNDEVVEVLPETRDVDGTMWAHVIAQVNAKPREGWVVQLYLLYETPGGDFQPAPTITLTPAP